MQTNSQAVTLFCKIYMFTHSLHQLLQYNDLNLTELFALSCKCIVMHDGILGTRWTPCAPSALNNSHIICTQPTELRFSYFLLHRWRKRFLLWWRREGRRAAGGFESASFRRRLFELRGSRCRRRSGFRVRCRHRWGCGGRGRGRGFRRRRRPRFGEHNSRLLVQLAGCGIQVESFFGCWKNKVAVLPRMMRRLEKTENWVLTSVCDLTWLMYRQRW